MLMWTQFWQLKQVKSTTLNRYLSEDECKPTLSDWRPHPLNSFVCVRWSEHHLGQTPQTASFRPPVCWLWLLDCVSEGSPTMLVHACHLYSKTSNCWKKPKHPECWIWNPEIDLNQRKDCEHDECRLWGWDFVVHSTQVTWEFQEYFEAKRDRIDDHNLPPDIYNMI